MNDIDISEEGGIRSLHFGSEWVQGAMRVRRPVDLLLEYTRDMLFGLLLGPGFAADARWPKRILLIGLGAGSLTKFCYWKLPQARVSTVEINPAVWAAARFHFKLPDEDERLAIIIDDGVSYMNQAGGAYDYILIDGYDENAKVGLLDSEAFYLSCWARLNPGGVLATNLFGRSRQYATPLKRLAAAFEGHSLALPACESGNVVALASRDKSIELPLEVLRERALAFKATTGLDFKPLLKRLEHAGALSDGWLRLP